jgi:uncharacterized protein (DUF1330 family)
MRIHKHRLPTALFAALLGLGPGTQARADEESTAAACQDPVIMIVSGITLDPERMGEYARALAASGLYPQLGGYYLNSPRPVAVFEGDVDPNYVSLLVRFPCLEHARRFWNSRLYQETVRPLRINPSAGDYQVTVYREADLPDYMQGKVGPGDYTAAFSSEGIEAAGPPED